MQYITYVKMLPVQTELVNGVVLTRGVLITAYSTVLINQDLLLSKDWHYIVLDEGHKIRNPDAQITLVCKQVGSSVFLTVLLHL